jgi:hypothetical protein
LATWPAGLIAVVLLVSDPMFISRSRLARNDMLAAGFSLLAFYLYEVAEDRGRGVVYIAAGLAAGAGVMSHTNSIYILAVVILSMILRNGVKVLKSARACQFTAGALAVMAYELFYDLIDYHNFVLQNRRDEIHFRVLQPLGWLNNLVAEPQRYEQWFNQRGVRILPGTALIRVFIFLAAVSLAYLLIRLLVRLRSRNPMGDPKVRVFVATFVVALVIAIATQRKITQYVVHLAPWFALCVGMTLTDLFAFLRQLRERRQRRARSVSFAAVGIVVVLVAAYCHALIKQNRRYLELVRDPDRATYEPFKAALRSIIPGDVCPVSVAAAYVWLAFPEDDQCYFAQMEARLDEPMALEGKEYALIVPPRFEGRLRKLTGAGFERFHLIGELKKTQYGTLNIYYTGSDRRYLSLPSHRYYFFGRQRGCVEEDQIVAGREVWQASAGELNPSKLIAEPEAEPDDSGADSPKQTGPLTSLTAIELEPDKIYKLTAAGGEHRDYELLVINDATGSVIQRIAAGGIERGSPVDGLFKTSNHNRIRLGLRALDDDRSLPFARLSIREIAPL